MTANDLYNVLNTRCEFIYNKKELIYRELAATACPETIYQSRGPTRQQNTTKISKT